jgi:uncharacterized damage-inducible protein DinB
MVTNTDTVKLLAAYNRAANTKMNEAIKTLSTEEWDRALGGYFPSVRSLCSHLYIADVTWVKRFARLPRAREFTAPRDPLFERDHSFKDVLFPQVEDYVSGRTRLDALLVEFAGELEDADLARDLSYSSSAGDRFTKNFGGLLLHAFNHDTHHRGMISLYLEILGRANDFNSLSVCL